MTKAGALSVHAFLLDQAGVRAAVARVRLMEQDDWNAVVKRRTELQLMITVGRRQHNTGSSAGSAHPTPDPHKHRTHNTRRTTHPVAQPHPGRRRAWQKGRWRTPRVSRRTTAALPLTPSTIPSSVGVLSWSYQTLIPGQRARRASLRWRHWSPPFACGVGWVVWVWVDGWRHYERERSFGSAMTTAWWWWRRSGEEGGSAGERGERLRGERGDARLHM